MHPVMALNSFPNSTSTTQQVGVTAQSFHHKVINPTAEGSTPWLNISPKAQLPSTRTLGFASRDRFKGTQTLSLAKKNVLGNFKYE